MIPVSDTIVSETDGSVRAECFFRRLDRLAAHP